MSGPPAWESPAGAGERAGRPQAHPGWGQVPGGWTAAPARPGIIPLRPVALGEIYDGAFRAIRGNPRTLIGISAVVIAATSLVTTVPQAAALTSFGNSDLLDPSRAGSVGSADVAAAVGGLVTALVLPALVQFIAVTVVTGLLILAVSDAVIGRATPPGRLWSQTRRRLPALVGLALLLLAVAVAVLAALLAPGILVLVLTDLPLLGVVLLVLGALLGGLTYLALGYGYWALAAPALLLENLSVTTSLRRSAGLVRGSFWRVLGILVLTAVIVSVLSGILSLPFTLIGSLLTIGQSSPYAGFGITLAQLLVSQIGTILAGAVLYPFTAAVTALLYIDLRMRREGLDVELLRAAAEPGASA